LMAGLTSAKTPQGDLALIYAFAKTMDPGSVVREQEGAAAANTASYWDAKAEQIKKDLGLSDARGLPESAARGMRLEMNRKVAEMAKAYGVQRARFQELAKQNGYDPEQVVGPMEAQPYYQRYQKAIGELRGKNAGKIAGKGDTFATSDDRRVAGAINAAFKGGATFEDLDAMHRAMTRSEQNPQGVGLGDEQRANVERRDAGQPVNEFVPAQSGVVDDFMAAMGDFAQTPVGTAVGSYANAALAGLPQLATGDAPFEAMRDRNPASALVGDVAGGLTTVVGGSGALAKAGMSLPRAATAANLGYGTLFGANTNEDNRLLGAGIGAGSSLAGDLAGRFIAAPLATRAIESRPVQAAANSVRGMFGRGPTQPPRRIDRAERLIASELSPRVDDITSRLDEAARLNLPFSIADADPAMRQQLGSASRLNPEVHSDIGRQLTDRSIAQADRALEGVSSLTPPVSMSDTRNAIRTAAWTKAAPLYEQAFDAPAPVNATIDEILNTPSGQKAARNAYDIGVNGGRSPADLALGLNPDGTARLDANPTYRTLDLVKRGFDQSLNDFRSPLTGRVDLEGNPLAQSVNDMRQRLVSELDAGNPTYKAARETYASAIRPREMLDRGYEAAKPGITQDTFRQMTNGLDEPSMDAFRRGYATSMADRINKARLSANPYDLVAGTPDQQAKLTSLFPNADDFLRRRTLEGDMALTTREVTGGSPTQGRAVADERFVGPGMDDVVDLGMSAVTGNPPTGFAARRMGGMFANRAQNKAAERAKSAAPFLFNPDPVESGSVLRQLIDDAAARKAFEDRIRASAQVAIGGGAGSLLAY